MTRLPDERDMEQAVRSWMRDEDEHPADRNRQVGRIMGRVDETRQRRGAGRFLPFWHRSRPDDDDDDLHPARRGGMAPSLAALVAVLALVLTSLGLLALRPTELPLIPGASPSPSPQPTMDPADQALYDRFQGVWSGERTSLDDVLEVYAEDAVHISLWQDKVEYFIGQHEIRRRIQESRNVDPGRWIRLPDSTRASEHRYLSATENLGGIACVFWIRDERITRHDCILPEASTSSAMPDFPPASPDTLARWEEIAEDFNRGWAYADRELIERTTSPEIVHHVAMDNHAYTLKGIDQYLDVMGMGMVVELAPPVALPAPEGEARWTDYGSVGGGSLCTFWARDGLIVRHDCVVPTSMTRQPVPSTPAPTAAT